MTPADQVSVPVAVVVARAVSGGREIEFHRWAQRLTDAAERFPGLLGWGLLKPAAGSSVWHVVYRFEDAAHLDAWEHSEVRAELLTRRQREPGPLGARCWCVNHETTHAPGHLAPA